MNRMRKELLTAGLLLLGVSAWAWQDTGGASLGEAAEKARREREARKGQKARSYTETDLRGGGAPANAAGSEVSGSGAAPAASPSPGAPGAKKAEKSDDELRADKKADFEKRIAEQVTRMDTIKKAMDEAQTELNDATTSTNYGPRRTALQKLLDDGQTELAKSRQTIADIEEEARRAGISVSR